MTWTDIEQKKALLVGGVIAICLAALAVTARRKPISFDSFWHLQTGLDWIHKGLSPWTDHFSFTYAGEAISRQPVLFQVALAGLVDALGLEAGFQVLRFASFVLAFGLMALFLRKLRLPVIAYLIILPLLTLLLELRSLVRPELFGYSLLIVSVMLYHRARGRVTWANVAPIALLMLAWSNYHSSILGYIVFFGFFVDAAALQIRARAGGRSWAKWLGWGLVVLGMGFLNKGFHHPLMEAFQFAPEWRDYIQEYKSAATFYKGVAGLYSVVAVLILTLFLAARQRKPGYLIVTLIFAYYSLRYSRLVTPCGIVVLCFLASLISEIDLNSTLRRQSIFAQRLTGAIICIVFSACLYSIVSLARDYMKENRTSSLSRPESIVSYMQDTGYSGRIFNEYGIGGYLIHMLAPDSTVYIDGRTAVLYPPEHHARFLLARHVPSVLAEEVKRYEIPYAVLESDRTAYTVMHEAGLLGLDYVDHSFSLFVRDNPGFPVAGRLLGNPACWQQSDGERLEAEHLQAIMTLPGNSSLLPVLGFMADYARQSKPEDYLRLFAATTAEDEWRLRFAAYRSLSLGLFETAMALLDRLEHWERKEYLSAALAYAGLEQWDEAEQALDSLTRVQWTYVTDSDLTLLYRLLRTIERHRPLQYVPASYVDSLREQVESLGEPAVGLEADADLLCSV